MITVHSLCKSFGETQVLRDLSLTVNGPAVLMGPSGCGKTTLLRILMGLETADAGTVQGMGRVAAVFQEDRLCPQLTAPGNIALTGADTAVTVRELEVLGFSAEDLRRPAAARGSWVTRRASRPAVRRTVAAAACSTSVSSMPVKGSSSSSVSAFRQSSARSSAARRR